MADLILIIPIVASFLITLFIIPYWIRKAHQVNLVWEDVNKYHAEKVAGSGGITAIAGFNFAVLLFVAYRTFYLNSNEHLVEIFSMLLVVNSLSLIGIVDDLLGWQHGGLSQRSRLFFAGVSAIPLIVISAGRHSIDLPPFGQINLGLFYPIVLIPIAIMGTAYPFNFLAGFNGLEAGQGAIILSALSAVSFLTGNSWLAIIGLCMVASLLALLIFNFYPARVFPGNSITSAVGSMIAMFAIFGNFEKVVIFFFIPYIIEVILKSRGRLKKQSFGKPNEDGTLDLRYDKIYGLEHLAIYLLNRAGIKATEKRVVYSLWAFQIIVILLGLLIFRNGIFG